MKANKKALYLAMARACVNSKDLPALAKLPAATINNVMCAKEVRPITLGKIARALGVDVTEILEKED